MTIQFVPVWERIRTETPLKNFIQLADVAGSSKQSVSRKKGEDDFPIEWAFKVGQKFGVNTDWILTGEGYKKRSEGNEDEEKATIKNMMSSYLEGALNALRKIEKKNSVSFISCLDKIHTELQKIEESEKEVVKKSVGNGFPE